MTADNNGAGHDPAPGLDDEMDAFLEAQRREAVGAAEGQSFEEWARDTPPDDLALMIEASLTQGSNMTRGNLAWQVLKQFYLGERLAELAVLIAKEVGHSDPLIFAMGMNRAAQIAALFDRGNKSPRFKVLDAHVHKLVSAILEEGTQIAGQEIPIPEAPKPKPAPAQYDGLGDIAVSLQQMKDDGMSVQSVMYALGRIYGNANWTELAEIRAELDDAIRDYRTVYPEPAPLAPNLDIAYRLMLILDKGSGQ